MNRSDIAAAIGSRFATSFASDVDGTVFDNKGGEPPVNLADSEVFMTCNILWGENRKTEVGATSRYRQVGNVVVNIYTKLNIGDGLALSKVDAVVAAFRTVTVSGLVFQTPSPGTGMKAGGYYKIAVSCPFYADDVS